MAGFGRRFRLSPQMRTPTILATALFATLAVADPALAGDGNPATSNLMSGGITIPYEGFLMLDDAPMTGTQVIRFDLWDDASASAATNLRYSETQTVTLFSGHFSAAIGVGTQIGTRTLSEAVLDGDRLYIAMAIQDAGGTFVPLVGRQAIEAVPYSAWSQNAANMSVAGDLSVAGAVQGSLQVNGGVSTTGVLSTTGGLQVSGGATISGNLSASGSSNTIASLRVQTALGEPLVGPTQASMKLVLTGGAQNDVVRIEGDEQVLGDSVVSGDISAQGNTWSGTCTLTTIRQLTHPTVNLRQCPDGTFVAGINFSFANSPPAVTDIQYVLTCCPL